VSIDLTNCCETKTFLSRAGFFDYLDERVNVIPERPLISAAQIYQGNSNSIVEFGGIDPENDNKGLISQLGDRFVQQSNEIYETTAFTVFGELIGNVSEHSESKIYGFAALQKYEGKYGKHIQTVVSDSGLGIANTLRPTLKKHHPDLYKRYHEQDIESDANLVETVLSNGKISRFGSGRGLGFESSCKQAMQFDAQLYVRQERFSLRFTYKNGLLVQVDPRLDLPKIMGTHLCFDFFVDPI